MADIGERVNYYDRQFLRAAEFQDEQAYHLDRRRRHSRGLHSAGVVEGLLVTRTAGTTDQVDIGPGWAVDQQGREIVLSAPVTSLAALGANADMLRVDTALRSSFEEIFGAVSANACREP